MYIDGVILFSLLMIVLIMLMMGYVLFYGYRHIKLDTKKANTHYNDANGDTSNFVE